MIICDTTNVNTGKKNGIVVKLQREFKARGLEEPKYIGCQHHVLDTILKHTMNFSIQHRSKDKNLSYPFVEKLQKEYEALQKKFNWEVEKQVEKNKGWRDDLRFLYELCCRFKWYKESGKFSKIYWRSLPSINSARWNSKGIYALLAYFLIPELRPTLEKVCSFISETWADIWFSGHMYDKDHYQQLHSHICAPAAKASLKRSWIRDPSPIDIPRTNVPAERAIITMQEIISSSKSCKYVSQKFVNTNILD